MSLPVRILLVDDHGLFREGLARLLDSEPGFTVAGHCATIDEALAIVPRSAIDLILLDYDLGKEEGTNILASLAVLQSAPRVLIVTAGMSQNAVRDALNAGALGVVLKHSGPQRLIDAIRDAVQLDRNLPREGVARLALPRLHDSRSGDTGDNYPRRLNPAGSVLQERPLTRRQSNALHAILDGLSNREIAAKMNMSESSVKAVVQELFDKAGVRTRSQLVRVAIEKHTPDWIKSAH